MAIAWLFKDTSRGKGQSIRLEKQHELAGGPIGIFGEEAQKHDLSIRNVMLLINEELQKKHPSLIFRHRKGISKERDQQETFIT